MHACAYALSPVHAHPSPQCCSLLPVCAVNLPLRPSPVQPARPALFVVRGRDNLFKFFRAWHAAFDDHLQARTLTASLPPSWRCLFVQEAVGP